MVDKEIIQVASTSVFCLFLIALRVIYRLTKPCRNHTHTRCHRKWHADDLWMGVGILPLTGRAVCIAWSNAMLDVKTPEADRLGRLLVLPGRVFYVLFLWTMKMCLLELYMRLSGGFRGYRIAGLVIRWSLYLTFVGVVLATLLECRPLNIAWNGDPAGFKCRKARANLVTMAVCNITTDLALIIFPMSFLRRSGLDFIKFIRLTILFALGSLIIVTTLIRLPLILKDNAQKTRSLWASIEIVCACIIANAAFFQAVYLDFKGGNSKHSAITTGSSSLDERRPSRRNDPDDEEIIGIWKSTAFGTVGKDYEGPETSSVTSTSASGNYADRQRPMT